MDARDGRCGSRRGDARALQTGGWNQRSAERYTRGPSGNELMTSTTVSQAGQRTTSPGPPRKTMSAPMAVHGAARRAAAACGRHLPAEDLEHETADGVAVDVPIVVHRHPPLGPKRSVRTSLRRVAQLDQRRRHGLDEPGRTADEAREVAAQAARPPRPACRGRPGAIARPVRRLARGSACGRWRYRPARARWSRARRR